MSLAGPRGRWLAASVALLALVAISIGIRTRDEALQPANDPDARIEFYRARLGGPGTYPAYARLGLAYLDKARATGNSAYTDEAARYLLESHRFQPNYEALRGLTEVALARHQFREALGYAEEAAKTLPGDTEAQAALFDARLALGDVQKAAAVLDRMLQRGADFVSFVRLANLREVQGNHRGALNAMGRACAAAEKQGASTATRAWCQVRLGSIYLALCDEVQAGHSYERALGILPGYFLAREHLAELRAAQGRQAEAIELYEKLLETIPGPHYRLALADLLTAPEQRERGAQLRRQALEELWRSVETESRADWRSLALLLVENDERVEEGLHWAERDWENRRDAFAADTLAWAYFRNGRVREAQKLIEQVLEPGGKDPMLLLHAAQIQLALRQLAKARTRLEQALACPLALQPAEKRLAERIAAELPR